MGKPAG
jgi:hypothetical protein